MNWDTLDDKGLPVLKKAESELSSEEIDKLGAWFWMIPGQSDHVDMTKFAVNAAQPPEKQNWVITNQANVFTPIMFMDDEFIGIADSVDPKSDEGIARALVEDFVKAEYPKVIMAKTPEEAEKIYQGIIDFADKNGAAAVEAKYTEKWKANVAIVGSPVSKK